MKNKILIGLLLLFACSASYAKLYDTNYFQGMSKSTAKEQFKGFEKLMSSTLNSGLGNSTGIDFARLGFGFNYQSFDKKDFLNDSSHSNLVMPYAYFGVSLLDYSVFARVMALPYKTEESEAAFFTLGLSKEIELMPLVYLYPSFMLHQSAFMDDISVTSFSVNLQGVMEFILISPYASLGVSYNMFNTELKTLDGDLSDSRFYAHAALGLKLLNFNLEAQLLPDINLSFTYSIGF